MIITRNQMYKSLFNMPIKKIETVYLGYYLELVQNIYFILKKLY